MSRQIDDIVSELTRKLRAGATDDEVTQVLETVDATSRENVLAQARRAATIDAEHEGGTDSEVGDLTGPGAGYDKEPVQVKDRGGVS